MPANMFAGSCSWGALYMAVNVVSSVALVLLNKVILSTLKFEYSICLTFFHTISTAIGEQTPPAPLTQFASPLSLLDGPSVPATYLLQPDQPLVD